jgi:hypothetical protein
MPHTPEKKPLIKQLKRTCDCETDKQLGEYLGIPAYQIYRWNIGGIPQSTQALMRTIIKLIKAKEEEG